jgi:hypothetical protein
MVTGGEGVPLRGRRGGTRSPGAKESRRCEGVAAGVGVGSREWESGVGVGTRSRDRESGLGVGSRESGLGVGTGSRDREAGVGTDWESGIGWCSKKKCVSELP